MKKSILLSLLGITLILASCASNKTESTAASSASEKFTTDWIEYSKENSTDCGYFYTTEELGEFSMIEGEFKKSAGYERSAFGFVFGYSSEKDGILSDYLRLEVNTEGQYAFYSWDGSKYTDFINPEAENTAYLNEGGPVTAGLDSVNKLKIEQDTSSGTYTCYINGTQIATGIEPIEGSTGGVMAFFSVGKENEEKLPDTPVKVTYRITDSAWYVKPNQQTRADAVEK